MFWLAEDGALLREVRHRGTLKVDWMFTFAQLDTDAHQKPEGRHGSNAVSPLRSVSGGVETSHLGPQQRKQKDLAVETDSSEGRILAPHNFSAAC